MSMEEQALQGFGIRKILDFLPHRYPFLLVDRVVHVEPGKSIHAYKNVSFNEEFFQGHFPSLPVMPGVLIMEALAQTGGLMVISSYTEAEKDEDCIFLFTGMEKVKFRRPVYPGDRLDLKCVMLRQKLKLWKISAQALVDGKLAAQAELSAAMTFKKDL